MPDLFECSCGRAFVTAQPGAAQAEIGPHVRSGHRPRVTPFARLADLPPEKQRIAEKADNGLPKAIQE